MAERDESVDELLSQARSRLLRLSPAEALDAAKDGAVIVDIRSESQRSADGVIPDARFIPRNVLEWRLDPRSDARLPFAGSYDLEVIVTCQEGYTSSLASDDKAAT